jgi:HD-like signal output (HDOD) protein
MPISEHSQSPTSLRQVVILQPTPVAAAPDPAIPIMQETLLLLDLAVQESSVDLREMSQLVLDDLGATLQILRLAGREYDNSHDRPLRIEDCISALGVRACMQTVSETRAARDGRQRAIAEMWAHAREIAKCSKEVADELPGINPDRAYLVGLLHSIGSLPSVLGWDETRKDAAAEALNGLQLAKRWSLPSFVQQFFAELQSAECKSESPEIVRLAHQRATRSSFKCSFDPEFRPILI